LRLFAVTWGAVAFVAFFSIGALAEEKARYDLSLGERDLGLGYEGAVLGIVTPIKYGPFVSYRKEDLAYEAAWFGGSMSIDSPYFGAGSVIENLLRVNVRRFPRNDSFNWILGLAQQTYYATVGRDIMANTSGAPLSAETIKIRTLGLQAGLGNRWQLASGLLVGVDWLVLNLPFMTLESSAPIVDYTNDAATRERVETAVLALRRLPTFTVAKVQLAYSF
jgi:hypothetical protein